VDPEEFKSVVHSLGLRVGDDELSQMHSAFDMRRDGKMAYGEFIAAVRGEMSVRRLLLVDRAFEKLDINGSGEVDLNDVKSRYNARNHAAVVAGQWTEDGAYNDFVEGFEGVLGRSSGYVTQAEFRDYYSEVSATLETDEQFVEEICNAWGVVEAGRTNMKLETVINQCRAYCEQRGVRSKSFFQDFDTLNCGLITEAQFLRCIKSSGLPVTPEEMDYILEAYRFTKNRAAMVKYQIFCNRVDGLEATHEKM